ncbi:MAG: kinase/pyrophosphorylase, partial [Snodgrassella sp.]|nr:kinase/pyrophosphorylase [Snodgrassella sp.]
MKSVRQVFFVSDRTGITAESMGLALLNQFDNIEFKCATYPFIDTETKAQEIVALINEAAKLCD